MGLIVFDLDDTLFPEIAFVESAYREIAERFGDPSLAWSMRLTPSPRMAFALLGARLDEGLAIYRAHRPRLLPLPDASLYALSRLSMQGHRLALVTDGRSATQRAKIEALGLGRYFNDNLVFISEEFGEDKTTGKALRKAAAVSGMPIVAVVGDNPAKDFTAALEAGIPCYCLRDSGRNIHPQVFLQGQRERIVCLESLYELPSSLKMSSSRSLWK